MTRIASSSSRIQAAAHQPGVRDAERGERRAPQPPQPHELTVAAQRPPTHLQTPRPPCAQRLRAFQTPSTGQRRAHSIGAYA